jgi:hypothetical protein
MPAFRSQMFRLRAIATEQRAREASDPTSKREWEDLAIEWHLQAHLAAQEGGDISQIEFAEDLAA